MSARPATSRRAFTLLESIIALALIGAVAGACLQLRAQSLAGRQRLAERQTIDRALDTILRLAQAGLLEGGTRERSSDGDTLRTTWSGEHLGEPFTCRRERVTAPNPVTTPDTDQATDQIELWSWTVEHRGETVHALTPLGLRR